jgi:hypothetical protein
MEHFNPLSAALGGLLIGTATVLYLVLAGRYVGISGIVRAAAFGDPDRAMDLLFVAGLVLGGLVWFRLGAPASWPPPRPLWAIAIGSVLVGVGTRLGHGCTSGHGLCGLGRLSRRSLVAVLTFIAFGMLTVFVADHIGGLA